jgi:hypothetical protein
MPLWLILVPSCWQNPATPINELPKKPPNTAFRSTRSTKYCRGSADSFSNVEPNASGAFWSASNRIERKSPTSLGKSRRILKEFKEFKEFRSSADTGRAISADLKVTLETEMLHRLWRAPSGCSPGTPRTPFLAGYSFLSLSPLDLFPSDFCPFEFSSLGFCSLGFCSPDFSPGDFSLSGFCAPTPLGVSCFL